MLLYKSEKCVLPGGMLRMVWPEKKEGEAVKLPTILGDRSVRAKEKARRIADALRKGNLTYTAVYDCAQHAGTVDRGTCLEALCIITKEEPARAKKKMLQLAHSCLGMEGNRVRWEAAELIGNVAPKLGRPPEETIEKLFAQTGDASTVVRHSTCYALVTILLLGQHKGRMELADRLEKVAEKEQNGSIKKRYVKMIRKARRS